MAAGDTPIRILLVENNERVRRATFHVLAESGYEVYAPTGEADDLVRETWWQLKDHDCHVAILDLVLYNDNDAKENSGQKLQHEIAQRYPGIPCIFYTAHGDLELTRKNTHVPVVGKHEGPAALLATLEETVQDHDVRRRMDIEFAHNISPDHLAVTLLDKSHISEVDVQRIREEVIELLARLFSPADQLVLSSLESSAPSVSANVGRSVLLRVAAHKDGRWMQQVLIKFGEKEAIRREAENYARHVDGQLQGERHTLLQKSKTLWHLGAIAYRLYGAGTRAPQTFKDLYLAEHAPPYRDTEWALQYLFGHVLDAWYSEIKSVYTNLFDHYSSSLELGQERLVARGNWDDRAQLHFPGVGRSVPNPIVWLKEHAHNSLMSVSESIIHGDLHSRNFFAQPPDGVWLLDFERTGRGHALRDAIELETDIKFSLLSLSKWDLPLFADFECALLSQTRRPLSRAPQPPEYVKSHAELYKAFQIISLLRRLVADKIRDTDFRDYHWGLLCQTLFVTTLKHLPREALERARLSAALICERLGDGERLCQEWPPQNQVRRKEKSTPAPKHGEPHRERAKRRVREPAPAQSRTKTYNVVSASFKPSLKKVQRAGTRSRRSWTTVKDAIGHFATPSARAALTVHLMSLESELGRTGSLTLADLRGTTGRIIRRFSRCHRQVRSALFHTCLMGSTKDKRLESQLRDLLNLKDEQTTA